MLFLIFYGVVNKKELVGGVEKYEFAVLEGCGGRVGGEKGEGVVNIIPIALWLILKTRLHKKLCSVNCTVN